MTVRAWSGGPLESERLRLRPLTPDDVAALHAITDDPAIIAAISFLCAPFTVADAAALIRRNDDAGDVLRGIWRRADDVLVGVVGAHGHDDDAIEIGYWIGTRFQGQGYAGEAAGAVIAALCRVRPDARIIAECRPDNRASWRVLERLGFRATGRIGARPGRVELALMG